MENAITTRMISYKEEYKDTALQMLQENECSRVAALNTIEKYSSNKYMNCSRLSNLQDLSKDYLSVESRPKIKTNDKFLCLSKYECVVEEFDGQTVFARCLSEDGNDLNFRSEIDISEIHSDDHKIIKPGAVFYLSIGKNTNSARTEMNDVDIKFRRMLISTDQEKEKSLQSADEILSKIRAIDGIASGK
jgi:hypothetical protein